MRAPRLHRSILLGLAAAALAPGSAHAVISDATTLEGPSPDIVDVGGVAMSEDGTGGVVYRKRIDGRVHIFAAQFAGGAWRAPQQVDVGQRFGSSWPAIGAADGGRLVVAWVQEFGVQADRLFSATIDPGARRFGAPVPIDLNVGEATATWPLIALNRGGQGLIAYRTTKDPLETPNLPPGTVEGEYRLARYNGQLWSQLGFPLNRNPASPVSVPDADNAPRVAIDAAGGAVVAWQERDDEFIDRIYARRVFGLTLGNPLLVSPQQLDGQPLRGAADQLALDVAGFGGAAIAFRQRPDPGGDGGVARVYVATIAETFTDRAATFAAARIADGLGATGPGAAPGPASVAAAPAGVFLTAFGVGTQSLIAGGDDRSVARAERLDAGNTTDPGDPVVDLSPSGALAAAWKTRVSTRGQVALRERRADGVPDGRSLFAVRGGRVVSLALAGSGLGDALVGWQQGTGAFAQVAVASINAPPEDFAVQTPADFINQRTPLTLRWDVAPNAIGDVRYAVVVDDEEKASRLTARRRDISLRALEDGVVPVSIIATDSAGQETTSAPTTLKLDRRAPRVRMLARARRRLRVEVTDGTRNRVSGADHAATRIRWGDGRSASGRAGTAGVTHTYRRAGRFAVSVTVRDAAGNRRAVRRRVRVR